MPLADYFLPAKSVFLDAPISGDIRFYQTMFDQLDGVRLMINERWVALRKDVTGGGPVLPALSPPIQELRSVINTYRARVEALMGASVNADGTFIKFLNTVTYPGANLNGTSASLFTTGGIWTKASIIAAAGVGVGGNWTKIPARNPFGYAASGSNTLARGDLMYVEHVNELVKVLDLMDAIVFFNLSGFPFGAPGSGTVSREGRRGTTFSAAADCATAKSVATAAWTAAAWGSASALNIGRRGGTSNNGGGGFLAELYSTRGKVRVDLTWIAAGTPNLYLYFRKLSDGGGAGAAFFGNTPPFSATEDTFQRWVTAGLVIGADTTTADYVPNSDIIPSFAPDACPFSGVGPIETGWFVSESVSFKAATVITDIPWVYALP